jgi:hypothetical protein
MEQRFLGKNHEISSLLRSSSCSAAVKISNNLIEISEHRTENKIVDQV